jgi:thiamine phosphate synthase YjbQ (UPF0047 family)
MVHQQEFHLETSGHRHMQDVTERVARVVAESGVRTGVVHVFNVGSTGAVGTIEFEPGLERDLPELLDRLIPPRRDYGHHLLRLEYFWEASAPALGLQPFRWVSPYHRLLCKEPEEGANGG